MSRAADTASIAPENPCEYKGHGSVARLVAHHHAGSTCQGRPRRLVQSRVRRTPFSGIARTLERPCDTHDSQVTTAPAGFP